MKTKSIVSLFIFIFLFTSCKNNSGSETQSLYNEKFLADSIAKLKDFMSSPDIQLASGKNMKQILGVANEDELVFDKLRIHSIKAENDIERAYHSLTVENGEKLGMLAARIPNGAIEWMYNIAKSINCSAAVTHSVTGIRIFYGLTSDYKKLQLFYQPVSFCRADLIYGQGGERLGKYKINDNGKFYEYITGDQFNEVTVDDKDDAFARYSDNTNGIRFVRGAQGERFKAKANDYDIEGDIESVTYSMQELFSLAESPASNGYVVLWNSIKVLSIGKSKQLTKHMLVLSSDDVEVNPADESDLVVPGAGANFMNLSHICPPSCNGLNYTFSIAY